MDSDSTKEADGVDATETEKRQRSHVTFDLVEETLAKDEKLDKYGIERVLWALRQELTTAHSSNPAEPATCGKDRVEMWMDALATGLTQMSTDMSQARKGIKKIGVAIGMMIDRQDAFKAELDELRQAISRLE